MKNCTDCKHASWKLTTAGRMHPSGDGFCVYPWKCPPLPASMYFIDKPLAQGGHINRREDQKEHCVYWSRK